MMTGTEPVSKPGIPNDSLAVARQFVHNVKPILDSLTALHFARKQNGWLQIKLTESETQRDRSTAGYVSAQTQIVALTQQLITSRLELGQYRQRYRAAKAEVWLWRIGAAIILYKKICPSCPP